MAEPADSIIARLRDFADGAAGASLMPIPHLDDDFVRRTTERDDFELLKISFESPAHQIDLKWNKAGREADLHEAVLYLLAWVGHPAVFIEKSEERDAFVYDVVARTPLGGARFDYHALRITISGEGVSALARRGRR